MSNKMLPSGISVRVREDLIDGVSRTQTTIIVDPLVTLSGHRITMADIGTIGYGKIDQGKASEEIISWTGITDNVTTYTLTGCTWGVNFHNLENATANIKRHVSGAQFAIMTDMHYIAGEFRDNADNVFTNTDPMEFQGNEILLGDGTSDNDKVIKADNGDANEPFMAYDEGLGKWVISNDGVNSYDPEDGGSGVTAGDGIDITGGEVSVDVDELVDDEALTVVGNRIKTVVNEDTGLFKDANGLNIDVIDPDNPVAQSPARLEGGTDSSLSNLILLAEPVYKENTTGTSSGTASGNTWEGGTITTGVTGYIEKIELSLRRGSASTANNVDIELYATDYSGIPTGAAIKTWSKLNSELTTNHAFYEFVVEEQLNPYTRYFIIVKYTLVAGGSDWVGWTYSDSNVNGDFRFLTSNAGTNWNCVTNTERLYKLYLGGTGGNNDGAFKAIIEGTTYDNLSIDLDGDNIIQGIDNVYVEIYQANWSAQTFTTPSKNSFLKKLSLVISKAGTPNGDLNVSIVTTSGGNPTSTILKTISVDRTIFTTNDTKVIDLDFDLLLDNSTLYAIVVSSPSSSNSSNGFRLRIQNSGDVYAGGRYCTSTNSGSTWNAFGSVGYSFFIKFIPYSEDCIASLIQLAIRTATSKLETVVWDTDHFVIASGYAGRESSVLKLQPPTTGTDISGAGYLDLGVNATEVAGDGDDYRLVRLDDEGLLPSEVLDGVDGSQLTASFNAARAIASDTLRASADTERSKGGTDSPTNTPTKYKEISTEFGGIIRVKFDGRGNNNEGQEYAQVYKNGVPVGTLRDVSSSTYTTFSEDLLFEKGDLIQLYIWTTFNNSSYRAYGKNFRVYYDLENGDIANVNLD